ncbi:UNVERIFIED_CONTAM: hypothetical protein GTU68_014393 [Idotea baltica]|nr:hypothetical protein [Idotea baltica]
MSFNIVLIEPEIPNNTGNIGRLSLAAGCNLHLVRPLGFDIDDSKVKRAGLDYWKHLSLQIYDNTATFFEMHQDKKMVFLSSHGTKNYTSIKYEKDMFLVFGKESVGLGESIINDNKEKLFHIPIFNSRIRSLNLANSVAIIIYEGIRSINQ